MTCSRSELLDEVAELAFHFSWSFDDLLDLEHGMRRELLVRAQQLAGGALE